MAVTVIMAIAVLMAAITTLVECIKIKKLEKNVTQLELDVMMLIQNSNTLDK